jgi:hypothetical protein
LFSLLLVLAHDPLHIFKALKRGKITDAALGLDHFYPRDGISGAPSLGHVDMRLAVGALIERPEKAPVRLNDGPQVGQGALPACGRSNRDAT